MARPTKTTSGRWEIKDPNNPQAKWTLTNPKGDKWRSKSEGDFDVEKVKKWVEDMQEWSEMMHEAVLELRESVKPIAQIQQAVFQLDAVVEANSRGLKRALKEQERLSARGAK